MNPLQTQTQTQLRHWMKGLPVDVEPCNFMYFYVTFILPREDERRKKPQEQQQQNWRHRHNNRSEKSPKVPPQTLDICFVYVWLSLYPSVCISIHQPHWIGSDRIRRMSDGRLSCLLLFHFPYAKQSVYVGTVTRRALRASEHRT